MKNTRLVYTILTIQSVVLGYLVLAPSQPTAMAQVPDQGAQLQQIIEESKALNAKMDRIIGILEGGKLQVRVVAPDK